MNKEFYLSKSYQIYLISSNTQQILFVQFVNKFIKMFKLPPHIFLYKKGNKLSIFIKSMKFYQELIIFCKTLFTTLKNSKKMYKKTLILKGLGFKINLLSNTLQFKLGFSHLVTIKILPHVLICVKKNIITFESYDLAAIGNLTNKVRSLKFPNTYKQKGFWYKNEQRVLKTIKKT